VDDQRVGSTLRAVRIRRGMRQVDLAAAAQTSTSTISRIEHGHLDSLSLRALRAVARALDVRLDLAPWSRRGDLARFATADHAALVEVVVRELRTLQWDARAEVSFSEYGERGFIDVLAWHAPTGALLVIEVKTEIVDVGETLGILDRKQRLAATIAKRLGWRPLRVSVALVVRENRMNRRRVADHGATFRSALPAGSRAFHAHLRKPRDPIAAVAFMSNLRGRGIRHAGGGVRRVARLRSSSAERG
jgi:transcriptional regulator with XRE-family HTH domain